MSPTDTVPYEDGVSNTSKQEPKKSFHLLAGIQEILILELLVQIVTNISSKWNHNL